MKWRDTHREHRTNWSPLASRVSTAGETCHTGLRPESHGTQQRCWRRSRSPERVRGAIRCRDRPELRTARSVPSRLSGASRSNGGRRHSFDQTSAGPAGGLVQNSIGEVSLVRRQKTGPIPQPVSRFVCLTRGKLETFVVVWSLVIGSRGCFRKPQVGGESDAARGRPARDQILLLPVSCVPPFRLTGHLGPPRGHCGLGGRAWRAGSPPLAVCIAAGEASSGVRVTPRAPSKTPRVLRARCALRPAPPHRPVGTRSPGHGRALEQLAGARRPPALSPQRPPARHQSRAGRRRA